MQPQRTSWLLALSLLAACSIDNEKESDASPCTGDQCQPDAGSDSGADGDLPTEACPTLGEAGKCDGNVLVYCEGDIERTLDCEEVSASCQVSSGRADCTTKSARGVGCGDVTALGTCDTTTLQYCDDQSGLSEVLASIECADFGQSCSPNGATDNGAICVPWGACPEGLTDQGACDGNTLTFCEAGELYKFDCGSDQCGDAGDGFFDCFVPGAAEGCGSETAQGRCDGNTLVRCAGDVIAREDCAGLGLGCGTQAGLASCRPAGCSAGCPAEHTCQSGVCRATAPKAEWTFMVYIVGDNNLSASAWEDLNEMESVGSTDAVRITAQVEFADNPWYSRPIPEAYRRSSFRFDVEKDSAPELVTSLTKAQDLGDLNMSLPATLSDFVRSTAARHPAKHYALTIWDHGVGWQGGFVDSGDNGKMSLRDLVDGVRQSGVHVDVLDFDACLMGMHEVALAFRGVADYLIASEEVEPGAGNPYDTILTRLTSMPTLNGAGLAEAIVDGYGESYVDGYRDYTVTKSALRLSEAAPFNDRLSSFAHAVRGALAGRKAEILTALGSADVIRFEQREYADIGSMLNVLGTLDAPIGPAANELRTAFGNGYVLKQRTQPSSATPTSGAAIFLPLGVRSGLPLSEYREATSFLPLQPWSALLASFQGAEPAPEQEPRQFAVVLSWSDEPDGETASADLDLHVYEPDGTLATPSRGTVSSNGFLSGDSEETGMPVEGYELKPDHASGSYVVLAHYYGGSKPVYPILTIFDSAFPDGQRTLARGKIENRKVVLLPMDGSRRLDGLIDRDNLPAVLDMTYSDIWYAAVIEVP